MDLLMYLTMFEILAANELNGPTANRREERSRSYLGNSRVRLNKRIGSVRNEIFGIFLQTWNTCRLDLVLKSVNRLSAGTFLAVWSTSDAHRPVKSRIRDSVWHARYDAVPVPRTTAENKFPI